ncbi:helix-turn-helix domain-containing GNAT family N-acetyltransferase [Pollutimonas bauzanensis]|uniref:Transcriptional regulator, MarR family with acetyltransferase activity n=1 Tax=Pollutimonas bauzanensis TaxID=658167 RepID=A0A1M5LYT0_9BURK|nr:helix-turn-helix domain-containing GNAT family N-acetyltransferase [Pollutimonas bauzanensis]SHG70252.1 transcriptional regulator, MarR family with acetyltransferase activity [Pollutimonas bauzanensis]
MKRQDLELIDCIRSASRQMVRELGFMQSTLAATDYPPSAVHTILEIGAQGRMTAAQLSEWLCLKRSSVSRMVRKLVDAGELKESASEADGRLKWLTLTVKGKRSRAAIEAFGRKQVRTALAQLAPAQQWEVAAGLATYAQALASCRQGAPVTNLRSVRIESGYRTGAIGRIVEMHAQFYAVQAGFGSFFERKVAGGLAEFIDRLERPCNGLWLALSGERIVGSVAIDGEDLGERRAHLRWFIMDEGFRGTGAGRHLLREAVAFCDEQRFAAVELWTFKGLDAARRLYEAFDFVLEQERPGRQWGKEVIEQRFLRAPRDLHGRAWKT